MNTKTSFLLQTHTLDNILTVKYPLFLSLEPHLTLINILTIIPLLFTHPSFCLPLVHEQMLSLSKENITLWKWTSCVCVCVF